MDFKLRARYLDSASPTYVQRASRVLVFRFFTMHIDGLRSFEPDRSRSFTGYGDCAVASEQGFAYSCSDRVPCPTNFLVPEAAKTD
jgi:hypothetical protein